jgi:hypothetical protein
MHHTVDDDRAGIGSAKNWPTDQAGVLSGSVTQMTAPRYCQRGVSVALLRKEIAIPQRGKSAATHRQVYHD